MSVSPASALILLQGAPTRRLTHSNTLCLRSAINKRSNNFTSTGWLSEPSIACAPPACCSDSWPQLSRACGTFGYVARRSLAHLPFRCTSVSHSPHVVCEHPDSTGARPSRAVWQESMFQVDDRRRRGHSDPQSIDTAGSVESSGVRTAASCSAFWPAIPINLDQRSFLNHFGSMEGRHGRLRRTIREIHGHFYCPTGIFCSWKAGGAERTGVQGVPQYRYAGVLMSSFVLQW